MSTFQRRLNLWDSTALVVGSMIGSGIFIVSSDMARGLGATGWFLLAWIISGILTVFSALVYGELAGMMPNVGGQYVYLREAYGSLYGFLYGWALFLVIQTGTIAAISMAFAKYLGLLIPFVSENNILLQVGIIKINSVHAIACFVIILLTWVNTLGVKEGKTVQNIFTFLKVSILFIFIVAGFIFASSKGYWQQNLSILWDTHIVGGEISGFGLAIAMATSMVGSMFALDSWYNVTFASDEVIDPKRNLPRSLILGTITVSIIYLFTNVVFLLCLPLRGDSTSTNIIAQGIQFAANDRVGTAAMYAMMGAGAAAIMAIVVMISTFGANNGIILSGARVYYSMANDGLFFKWVATLNKKGVPAKGLVLQGVWSFLLCLSGSYSQLLDYVIFVSMLFLVLTCFAVIKFRRTRPDAERPYKVWGYPYVPIIYIVSAVFIMIVLLIKKPLFTWPGLGIVVLGIPVYYLWKNKNTNNI